MATRTGDAGTTGLGDGSRVRQGRSVCTARFYADHVLSQADWLAHAVAHEGDGALAIEDEAF
jgi:hypothetical protein